MAADRQGLGRGWLGAKWVWELALSRRTSSPRFSARRRLRPPPSRGHARCRADEAAGAAVQAEPVSPLPLHVQFCSASGLRSLASILGRGHKGQGIKKKIKYLLSINHFYKWEMRNKEEIKKSSGGAGFTERIGLLRLNEI